MIGFTHVHACTHTHTHTYTHTHTHRGRVVHYIAAHIEEISENGADVAHLTALHHPGIAAGGDPNFAETWLSKLHSHTWTASWQPKSESLRCVFKWGWSGGGGGGGGGGGDANLYNTRQVVLSRAVQSVVIGLKYKQLSFFILGLW